MSDQSVQFSLRKITKIILISGFDAYLGFIHTENYQMNPVVNVFIDILRLNASKHTQRYKVIQERGTDIGQDLGKDEMELGA